MSCSIVKIYRHFEENYGLRLQCNVFYFFQDIVLERATFHSIIQRYSHVYVTIVEYSVSVFLSP